MSRLVIRPAWHRTAGLVPLESRLQPAGFDAVHSIAPIERKPSPERVQFGRYSFLSVVPFCVFLFGDSEQEFNFAKNFTTDVNLLIHL